MALFSNAKRKFRMIPSRNLEEDFMSRIPRIGITSFLLTVFVALCLPVSLSAMTYRQFDTMNMLDQAEYIAVMVDTTQQVLRVSGGANYAAQIEQLFAKVEP